MTRFDWTLLALGPFSILMLWALLPPALPEGARAADGEPSDVVAELVGYAFEAADRDPPQWLGRGAGADLRLSHAPIARRAALLLPPRDGRPFWEALPAEPGLTLRTLTEPLGRETSLRPWADDESVRLPFLPRSPEVVAVGCGEPTTTITPVPLRQLRLQEHSGEPEILWLATDERATASGGEADVDVVSCAGGRVFWKARGAPSAADPCTGGAEGWKRVGRCWIGRPPVCIEPFSRAWGLRIRKGGKSRLRTPWSERFREDGLGVVLAGPSLRSIRLGLDGGVRDPKPLSVYRAADGELLATLGPLALRDGELLAVGRTRFLVRTDEGSRRLELYHVRDPSAPGHFLSSAGHDVYHPNRRALWTVPACDESALALVVQPEDGDARDTPAAELALRDRERLDRIAAARLHRGVPRELAAVEAAGKGERALLSLCAEPGERGGIGVRLAADSPRRILLTEAGGTPIPLPQGETHLALGTSGRPREVLVELDGNLIRVAPVAAPRVTRRVRLGLAGYLIFVLTLQAVALGRARAACRTDRLDETAWPSFLGPPTLQQLTGTAIAVLLFAGADFQLFLALHPELAGKPDYAQAFLQGVVAVAAVLAAAAGFAAGGASLPRRSAGAALGASLALLGAAAWWWWDSLGVPAELWLTAFRNRAVASSGSSPGAFLELLLYGAAVGLAAAVLLVASGAVPWPRLAEWTSRRGLRAPLAVFAALAGTGLAVGVVRRSALAFELAILAGLAWYAAVYWSFVRRGRLPWEDRPRREAALLSMGSGLLVLVFLVVFFVVGADLPDVLSFVSVAAGLGIVGAAVRIMVVERFAGLLRVLLLWAGASLAGCAFASLILTDMGSIAAWVPALLAGLFLWLVRPEERTSRAEEPRKALTHLLLALGLGLVVLGVLDVFKTVVQGLEWQALDRPRQRLDLADDVSYVTSGEWITQVRWLASQQGDDFQWVPNVNSDVAIFGLAAGVGAWLAAAASALLLGVAGCAGLAADQALRRGHAAARAGSDRLYPTLHRALGLFLGMVSVLLIAQWLVHLATGVVLHLPVTGLVFPWISHGNTTHLLYAAAIVFPMAASTALATREKRRR